MKKAVVLFVVAVVASACLEKSDPKVNEKETPAPNTLDSVTEPGDAAAWTPDKCMVDSDCAEMAVGTCETAYCDKGECVKMAAPVGKQCEAEGLGECQSGQCEPVDGAMACVAVPAANGTPCGEFFVACGGAGGCLDGACDDPCDDGNPCTDGKCTATGCVYTNNTVKCDDGDPCTANDVCADGVCGGEKVCDCTEDADCEHLDDGNPCTGYHECKANGTCAIKAATVVKCPETGFEPCQTNECNPASGKCVETVVEDGVECDDAIECTTGDFCVEGECTGIGDITCEYVCDDGVDEDEDGVMDCDEPECWGVGDCAQPECGDGTCQEPAEETCLSCPEDCGACNDCPCEEGFVCVGGVCAPLTVNGAPCSAHGDCASGFCVDGVCCDTACHGTCKGCSISGSKGTCTPVPENGDLYLECGLCKVCDGAGACKDVVAGWDIKDDCPLQAQESCGLDGTCDGQGACAYYAAGAPCKMPLCAGSVLHVEDQCDGQGTCVDAGTVSCCPYACNDSGKGCRESCSIDAHCCGYAVCSNGSCVAAP
jgi:hypothetical protein